MKRASWFTRHIDGVNTSINVFGYVSRYCGCGAVATIALVGHLDLLWLCRLTLAIVSIHLWWDAGSSLAEANFFKLVMRREDKDEQ